MNPELRDPPTRTLARVACWVPPPSTVRWWESASDSDLLDVRLCDLDIAIEGTVLERRIERLHRELAARGLSLRPHCWLSEEWFSPDGVPGIAIPFYLAHPRLMRLECRQMCEVEGGTEDWCMRLLRHEAGHAIDAAFRLRRRREWQRHFGRASVAYPTEYQPNPYSRDYVLHLGRWYAQSHPTEDFAETFALWLKPGSRWRRDYAGWPARRKLEYVDGLMRELRAAPPPVATRERVDPLSTLRTTLRQHYVEKRARYQGDGGEFADRDLMRLFTRVRPATRARTAAAFLRRHSTELRRVVVRGTGEHPYTIDQVFHEALVRCRELGLYVRSSTEQTKLEAAVFLSARAMRYRRRGEPRFSV